MTFVRATRFLLSRGGGCEVAVQKKENDLLHSYLQYYYFGVIILKCVMVKTKFQSQASQKKKEEKEE